MYDAGRWVNEVRPGRRGAVGRGDLLVLPPTDEWVVVVQRLEASAVTHMLVVADASTSRDWYVRCLDATVTGEYGGTSVVLRLLDSWFLLVTGGGPDAGKPTVTLQPPDDVDRVATQVILRVADCHATHELLAARGVEFLAPPHERGTETRAFFRDPDGHLFEISSLEDGGRAG